MLEKIFRDPRSIARIRESYVGRYMDRFAADLIRDGYGADTLRVYLPCVRHFGWWMERHRLRLNDANATAIEGFGRHLKRCRCVGPYGKRMCTRSAAMAAARHFLRFLCKIRGSRLCAASAAAELKKVYIEPGTIERMCSSFVGRHVEGFTASLAQAGYTRRTIACHLPAIQHLGWWMKRRRIWLGNLDERTVEAFRRHLRSCRCVGPYHNKRASRAIEVVCAANRFLEYLRRLGVARPSEPTGELPVVVEFRSWMKKQRGTADTTLKDYSHHIGKLLRTVDDDLSRLNACAIRNFVLRSSPHTRPCTHTMVSAVRAFARFLIAAGRCASDLDRAVPAVAQWRLSALPRYISYEDVNRLIATCDRRTEAGTRDRAILLLFARLALRACDVRTLRLSDFDWNDGSVIVSGKSARETRLPLPQEVGDAVIEYLQKRPRTNSPLVFQKTIAPHGPMGPATMGGVVRAAIAKAGIRPPSFGTHLLRHSAATEMLRQGAALDDIRVVLRHSSPETTLQYSKVDFEGLKTVAQPWPEGAPC